MPLLQLNSGNKMNETGKANVWIAAALLSVMAAATGATGLQSAGKAGEQDLTHESKNVGYLEITVLYDNNPHRRGLETAWGFSCLVRGTKKTILFDTGGDGSLLLRNMKGMGIDPRQIDLIVLSHIHGDHVGGLRSILEKNPDVAVYLPESLPGDFKEEVKGYGAKVIDVRGPLKICGHVYSTGELGTLIKEQSLIVKTEKGIIVITGCAHPGILEIIKTAKDLTKDDVLLVIGGYHLGGKSNGEIEEIVKGFRKLGVRSVGPCHCTGDRARQSFEQEYQENYIDMGVGKVITMERFS
jgi:7,8-dihydropterin-6-yl-methyl-4-(beta-D-ribofuranosyl)aminobenzene 5'-phosphate synthase